MVAAKHVVWDWNGTLYGDAEALIASTIEAFGTAGLALTPERYRRMHTQPIDEFYDRLFGGPVPDGTRRSLHAAFAAAYARRQPELRLSPGTRDSLRQTAELGLSQSVLSMHPHDRLLGLVVRFGIDGYFARIDGQRGPDAGYKAEHLAGHLRALGRSGHEVLLIGDSVDDARAAKEVGARCVLYASGLHAFDVLEAEGVPVVESLPAALVAGLRGGA
ncbi:HAD family hydrolase [Saccharopolyspora taberi]|uniref:HAD-IA family hydrolase n=1 Tax=Saccharopolyspora taberi TaxID=60895 RepID=A0ABN3VGI7_9PSEU